MTPTIVTFAGLLMTIIGSILFYKDSLRHLTKPRPPHVSGWEVLRQKDAKISSLTFASKILVTNGVWSLFFGILYACTSLRTGALFNMASFAVLLLAGLFDTWIVYQLEKKAQTRSRWLRRSEDKPSA